MQDNSSERALTIGLVTSEYVTEEKYHGGLANYIHRIAMALHALGHKPHVIVASTEEGTEMHGDIPIHKVPVRDSNRWRYGGKLCRKIDKRTRYRYHMGVNFLQQSYALNVAVKRLHRTKRFDVVQYAQLGGLGVFRSKKIPSVVRLSSLASLWFAHGGFGELERGMHQQELLELISIKKADAVFGPSAQIAEYVSAKAGRDISVIESPYISDVDQLDTSVYDTLCSQKKYLLFFGSIGHIKGVGTIASIIYPLLTQYPDIYFVFVGKRLHGQEGGDLMEQVWRNAAEHKHRVIWHDSVRHPQLYPIIEHAHAVVLPSRIDNFPNACIEAMAHKKVVIGTKGNGFEQLINHGRSGLLCMPNESQDLLRTIQLALLLTDEERRKIGTLAAQRIDELQPKIVGQQLVDLYNSIR